MRIAVGGSLLLSPVMSLAVPISPGGGFFVASSPVYRVGPPAPNPVWDVISALNSGTIKKPGGVGNQFQWSAGDVTSFTWTGSPLGADISAGGLANAVFTSGGTMILYGKVRDATSAALPKPVVFDSYDPLLGGNPVVPVPILVTHVDGFELRETDVNSNVINSVNQTIKFTVVDGYLATNPIAQLSGQYSFAITGAVTGPVIGGPLNDFSEDLKSLSAFQINFNQVPEPCTIALLACGAVMLGRGRRKASIES